MLDTQGEDMRRAALAVVDSDTGALRGQQIEAELGTGNPEEEVRERDRHPERHAVITLPRDPQAARAAQAARALRRFQAAASPTDPLAQAAALLAARLERRQQAPSLWK
jgi:hypothetical protein